MCLVRQALRRLCGLCSPTLGGRSRVNPTRVSEMGAQRAFKEITHTFMSKLADAAFIREAVRLLQVTHIETMGTQNRHICALAHV